MLAATKEIFTGSKSGQQILDIFLEHAPDEEKNSVRSIFTKWVEGYSP